jgi:hypothetical protein
MLLLIYVRGWELSHPKDPIKFVFDVGYPTSDIINLILLTFLIRNPSLETLGDHVNRSLRIITTGTVLLLVADLCFSITTSLPETHPFTYFNGSLPDFMFATAFYVLGLGVLDLTLKPMMEMAGTNRSGWSINPKDNPQQGIKSIWGAP